MAPEESAEATKIKKPEIAILMYLGDTVGSINDANKFLQLCKKNSISAKLPVKS